MAGALNSDYSSIILIIKAMYLSYRITQRICFPSEIMQYFQTDSFITAIKFSTNRMFYMDFLFLKSVSIRSMIFRTTEVFRFILSSLEGLHLVLSRFKNILKQLAMVFSQQCLIIKSKTSFLKYTDSTVSLNLVLNMA